MFFHEVTFLDKLANLMFVLSQNDDWYSNKLVTMSSLGPTKVNDKK